MNYSGPGVGVGSGQKHRVPRNAEPAPGEIPDLRYVPGCKSQQVGLDHSDGALVPANDEHTHVQRIRYVHRWLQTRDESRELGATFGCDVAAGCPYPELCRHV